MHRRNHSLAMALNRSVASISGLGAVFREATRDRGGVRTAVSVRFFTVDACFGYRFTGKQAEINEVSHAAHHR